MIRAQAARALPKDWAIPQTKPAGEVWTPAWRGFRQKFAWHGVFGPYSVSGIEPQAYDE
jgi:hypothetical protein